MMIAAYAFVAAAGVAGALYGNASHVEARAKAIFFCAD